MRNKNKDREELEKVGVFITIPFVLAVPPIIGWLIGNQLDKYFKTEPFLMFSLLLAGFIAGFRELYKIVKRFGDGE